MPVSSHLCGLGFCSATAFSRRSRMPDLEPRQSPGRGSRRIDSARGAPDGRCAAANMRRILLGLGHAAIGGEDSRMSRGTGRLTTAEKITIGTAIVGFLHHIDHVLRFDHSGWPFVPQVTVFTYSLLVYPAIAALLLARGWARMRVVLAFLLFLFPTMAHIFIETPVDQYSTWCSSRVNLLAVDSPVAGVAAGAITIVLSTSAFIMFLAYVREARDSPQARSPT